MLRYENLSDISDGHIYQLNDSPRLNADGCRGCSKCCESDMGTSIVLDPYDVFELMKATGKSFDDLLVSFAVEVGMIDGLALPHLKMDKGCSFLKDGRCSIHDHRPSICRLFPLGRLYREDGSGFDYILQVNECAKPDRTEVKIDEWLGIPDIERHSAFINKWHRFIRSTVKSVADIREREAIALKLLHERKEAGEEISKSDIEDAEIRGEQRIKALMMIYLRHLYMEPYDLNEDFYPQFDSKLKMTITNIRRSKY